MCANIAFIARRFAPCAFVPVKSTVSDLNRQNTRPAGDSVLVLLALEIRPDDPSDVSSVGPGVGDDADDVAILVNLHAVGHLAAET